MSRFIYFVEAHLVWFVIVVAGVGLLFPATGIMLEFAIGPLLALLMLIINLEQVIGLLFLVLKEKILLTLLLL